MTVFMFPGQGAQKPGMGADLLEVAEVAHSFSVASDVCGIDVAALAKTGSAEEINDAYNAQVLAVALSVGISRALGARGIHPEAALGFSLGQISALIATEALSEEDGFSLLGVRARSMAEACNERPGAMYALLGATHEDAQGICNKCAEGDVLVCANYNAPGQVVVSGDVAAINRAEEAWRSAGKRGSRLNTAGAFHSPLMASAAEAVRAKCAELSWSKPCVPVICNTDAQPFAVEHAAERLASQVVSPVRFEQSVQALVAQGTTQFAEVGFGAVLNGLVRRIDKASGRVRVGTLEEFNAFVAAQADAGKE